MPMPFNNIPNTILFVYESSTFLDFEIFTWIAFTLPLRAEFKNERWKATQWEWNNGGKRTDASLLLTKDICSTTATSKDV